jgi:ferritin-like metal-binding protein YciE
MRNSRQGRLEKPSDGPSGREPDSPAQQTSDCAFQTVLEDVRVNKALRWASEDAHKMRLKQLKAKLTKHIDETEWMYDSLDTILGFSK